MTDLARLALEVDSREVKTGVAELDKLTAAGAKAEKAVDRLGDQAAASGRQLKGAGAAAAEMASEAQRAARSATGLSSGVEGAGKASGLAAHHVQNLAFQINDMVVGLASGQKPITVFMQQGAQIGQIAAQAGTGIVGMTASLIAANPVLALVAAGAGAVALGFGVMTAEINKTSAVTVTWQDVALASMQTVKSYLEGELIKGFEAFGVTTNDVWNKTVNATKWALNYIIGAGTFTVRSLISAFKTLPAALGDAFYSATNLAVAAIETLINRAIKGIAVVIATTNPLLAAAGMVLLGGKLPEVSLGRIANPYEGGIERFAGGQFDVMRSSFTTDYLGNAAGAVSERAQANATERNKAKAKKMGSEAGKAGGTQAAEDFDKAFWEALAAFDPKNAQRMKDYAAQTESDLYDIRQASAAEFDVTYKALNAKIGAQQRWNDELVRTAYLFGQLGGIGGGIADALNILGGNYGAVGGPLGAILQTSWTNKKGEQRILGEQLAIMLDPVVKGFDKALNSVFGKNGSFTGMLQGAGNGLAMGQLLFGNNQGAQIGGMIGGSLGSLLGPVGNIVGSIIGSTLGKLLGGGAKYGSAVVGPNGVTVGGNNDNSRGAATGAGGAVSDAINRIAEALGGTVGSYAVSIGETDGKWRISTSGRSGELKSKYSDVQVFGKGDAAAEQALKAAIADAIKDGAIQGVSAAVGRLLAGGGDIDKQVQKAQLFQGVFSELKAQTDPLGAALDNVAKQFDALRGIFDEAGASAEEYASLEQLLAIKRQEAVDAARSAKVEKITDQFNLQIRALELLGKSETALAASRLLELAGMKDTLKPIQEMIYQLEDAQAVMSQFKPLADDLRAYRKELVGTSSVASYGAARALFASTAASAAMGDAAALGNLRGVSDSYLASAKANARSGLDYNRARGQVLAAVDQGIFAADAKVDYAQATIDAIDNSAQIMQSMREELRSLGEQTAANTAFTANLLKRFDGADGLIVTTSSDAPLQVEISA